MSRPAAAPAGPAVAVVGVGLIGGAVALRLRRQGVPVRVWDASAPTRAAAARAGLACGTDLPDAVADAAVVVLAAPLRRLPDLLDAVVAAARPDAVVTDVGSTKGGVAARARQGGYADRFVAGHPMAGGPRAGFDAGAADLLVGVPWALSGDGADPAAYRQVADLLRRHFDARIVPVDAAGHDAAVALVSHLPHLLAAVLANTAAPDGLARRLAAASYARATASAASAPYRSTAMVWENRAAVRATLRTFAAALADADRALQAADDGDLRAIFDAAHAACGPPAAA
ncbi:prephenate dehydrogenase [Pilimelia terevasa]|uniref:Prephenate dehydrogenase n=1 Tax=Pilimelia terevasa TaxID=53372 RepID=A0A8J3BPM4_9ACTN|nr:prephenate dehydrogenase/arogenate dehydrogenase family protein [Pilimelia terevasa]GGK29207.1 prephenate dehydrogenase [Pilimelia terevasa]